MKIRREGVAEKLVRWGPVVGYVILIFAVSSMSNPPAVGSVPHLDKVAHLFEYGVLGCLLAWALGFPSGGRRAVAVFFRAFAIGAAVGLADELYQGTVPGRQKSIWDLLTDLVGLAAFQMLLVIWVLRRSGSGDKR
jgi:VanZ family protein